MRRRGFTLIELTVGMGMLMLVVLGCATLMVSGLQSLNKTSVDANLGNDNAQGLRRVSEAIRGAVWVSVSTDGRTLSYSLPRMSTTTDPLTGERELVDPPVSDGVVRRFVVDFTAGTLTDMQSNRVLVRNIAATDPQPSSSLFNQAYPPFQLTTIGSMRAVSINLITRANAAGQARWVRLKTSAVIRNSL